MSKNIAIFLDGTWNDPSDHTRVWVARKLVSKTDASGQLQLVYYDVGLGTKSVEAFRGGVFGHGLGKNVREAYAWLSKVYDDNDKVFIFGFSRGAFTATSLAGMIMRCGLLRQNASMSVDDIFKRYRKWNKKKWRAIYELEYAKKSGEKELKKAELQLLTDSRRIQIEMVGVWDSVSTVGVPILKIPQFSRKALEFHNPRMSKTYESFFHALAVDEHRKPFKAVLLHDYIPDNEHPDRTKSKRVKLEKIVEQRWFCGAHGDVGGGDNSDLAALPFRWIMEKASNRGLKLERLPSISGQEHTLPIKDSFSDFLKGFYKKFRFGKRYMRPIGRSPRKVTKGKIEPIHEVIDLSVFDRIRNDLNYRPQNVVALFNNEREMFEQISHYKIER